MTSRPPFLIDHFVRARRAFDSGNGPAEAWARMTEISLWRLDELAERSGIRAWALLVAPAGGSSDKKAVQHRLHHAVRSADLGMQPLRVFSMSATGDVSRSKALAVFEVDGHQAEHLGCRYGQIAALVVQRVPYGRLAMMELPGGERMRVERYEPAAIASALAHVGQAASVAIEYVPVGWFERLALYAAEARLATSA